MATGDFDTYYTDNPWEAIDKNQRTWYDPDLIAMYRQRALFTPTIQFTKNLGDVRATKMVLTQLLDPHPDYTALAVRQIWMPASHLDSRACEITFSRYGGKVAYTVYDDMVTYWKQNGTEGLRRIMKGALGQHMIDVQDLLARNAYIKGALDTGYALYPGATSFDDIATDDLFDLDTAMDIWLGMSLRGVASALGQSGAANSIVCYTSPSVIYDIQAKASSEWVAVNQYQGLANLLKYEVGSYKNVRFVQSPKLVLWNCGTLIAQAPVSAAIHAGDGAPDPSTSKVDGVWQVGQETSGIVNYITPGTFTTGAFSNISVNDVITIHLTRTASYGVTNGVNPFEGTLHNRRVVAKLTTPDRLVLDQPIMIDMATDLGAGVYGYITKGRNIHSSIFVGGPNGIVSGVAAPPRLHSPAPVDDFEMVQRFSWDSYMGYQPYAPEVFEVVFSAGTTRTKGAKVVQ
jgi:N4-gp56 family major capsid protein